MIGSILGICVSWAYLSSSWQHLKSGDSAFSGFGQAVIVLAICCLFGLFLFPRTVGLMFTPAIFIAPVAFIIGWVTNGLGFGFSQFLFGIIAWAITQAIAKFRPRSAT